jgi:hypothetical protein
MITMIAMIVFAKREARGYPPPPYTPTCAMMEQLPMQQKQMQPGSVRILIPCIREEGELNDSL